MRTTIAKIYIQSRRAESSASSEHFMSMMEVVAWMKGKTDTYQREALIELENLVLDTGTERMLKYIHLMRDPT